MEQGWETIVNGAGIMDLQPYGSKGDHVSEDTEEYGRYGQKSQLIVECR